MLQLLGMRLLTILIVAVVVYMMFFRAKSTPTAEQIAARDTSNLANDHSNFVKRPLDRAHAALEVNKKRTSDEP